MSALATKQQSLKIFEKLKTKPTNKVCSCQNLFAQPWKQR